MLANENRNWIHWLAKERGCSWLLELMGKVAVTIDKFTPSFEIWWFDPLSRLDQRPSGANNWWARPLRLTKQRVLRVHDGLWQSRVWMVDTLCLIVLRGYFFRFFLASWLNGFLFRNELCGILIGVLNWLYGLKYDSWWLRSWGSDDGGLTHWGLLVFLFVCLLLSPRFTMLSQYTTHRGFCHWRV